MIKITEKSKCSGCHACASICPKNCIEMKSDSEGFWYPVVEESKCINCNLCEKICPVLHDEHNKIKREPVAYATYNKNEEIRLQSSSGGVFTLIAEKVLNQNGVVFGACFDESFNVVHDYADNIEGLEKFRGSKYVQSKIGNTYKQAKEFLDSGRLVLFTGTPCQIGGLKAYLKKDYDNLICQDLICHGVPSPKVWQKYVSFRKNRVGASARRIFFRHKKYGWKRFSVSFLFNNDTEYHQTLDKDLMMKAFLQNACLRPSCYDCKFKNINRQSDITLADFWGIQNIMPEMDDDKGTSLLILNTELGRKIFDEIKQNTVYKQADLNQAISCNISMIKSVGYNKKRDGFLRDIDKIDFDKCVKKYCEPTVLEKCIKFPRRVLGKIKRKILNKR